MEKRNERRGGEKIFNGINLGEICARSIVNKGRIRMHNSPDKAKDFLSEVMSANWTQIYQTKIYFTLNSSLEFVSFDWLLMLNYLKIWIIVVCTMVDLFDIQFGLQFLIDLFVLTFQLLVQQVIHLNSLLMNWFSQDLWNELDWVEFHLLRFHLSLMELLVSSRVYLYSIRKDSFVLCLVCSQTTNDDFISCWWYCSSLSRDILSERGRKTRRTNLYYSSSSSRCLDKNDEENIVLFFLSSLVCIIRQLLWYR